MKRLIIFLSILMLAIPISYGFIGLPQTSFNISQDDMLKDDLYFYDDFPDPGNGAVNMTKWTQVYATGTYTVSGDGLDGALNISGNNDAYVGIRTGFTSVPDICIDFRVKRLTDTADGDGFWLGRGSSLGGADSGLRALECGDDGITGLGDNNIGLFVGGLAERFSTGVQLPTADFINATIVTNADGTSQIYLNNGYVGNVNNSYTTLGAGYQILGVRDNDKMLVDYFYVYNCTAGFPYTPPEPPPESDNPAPSIYLNEVYCQSCNPYQKLASNYGGTPFITDDTTPTINVTLNASGTCAIMGNESSLADYAYTDMIANGGIECATTGTTIQVCTIQASNIFTTGNNKKVCIGCKSDDDIELSNATACIDFGIYTFSDSGTGECTQTSMTISSGCGIYNEGGITKIY